MSLEKLLETGIINDAYPVHDGNIKFGEGDDPNNINDRQVSIDYDYTVVIVFN